MKLTIILLLLLTIDTYAGPVDFATKLETAEIGAISPREAFYKSIYYTKINNDLLMKDLTYSEIETFEELGENPNLFHTASAAYSEERALSLHRALGKLPGITKWGDGPVFRVQITKGSTVLTKGDYVVSNRTAMVVTEDEKLTTENLSNLLDKQVGSGGGQKIILYQIDVPNNAKPIGGVMAKARNSEALYTYGSAFEVVGNTSYNTIKSGPLSGKSFFNVNLKEVDRIPADGDIYYYRGFAGHTTDKLTALSLYKKNIPEEMKVKFRVPECCEK